jgi:GNAT superfamily N-acetyltransferase
MAPIHTLQQSALVEPMRFGTLSPAILDTRPSELGGERLLMRRLRTADLTKIEEHLLDLCRVDRATRFLGALSDEMISSYARHLDPSAAIMVGVLAPSGRLLGFAEAEPSEATGTVEIAVTVAHDFRRKGLGRALVAQVVELSFIEGARIAEFNFWPSNKAIVCLISSLGGRFGPFIGQASISRGSKPEKRAA